MSLCVLLQQFKIPIRLKLILPFVENSISGSSMVVVVIVVVFVIVIVIGFLFRHCYCC